VTTSGNKAEHHEVIRGSVGHYGLSNSELELKTPLPLHLDHTHSIYVAVGTLVSAVIVVVIAVIFSTTHRTFHFHHVAILDSHHLISIFKNLILTWDR
jgi:hypothetical protein